MGRVTDDARFGLTLYPQPSGKIRCGERDFTVIGQIGGPDEEQILLDGDGDGDGGSDGDGRVLVLQVGSQELSPLNSSLDRLRSFLAACERYYATAAPTAGPMVLSGAQLQERLAAMHRGELKPAAPAPAPLPHKKRVKLLRKTLKDVDPAAIKPGTWWGFILEQLDDDLL
jgi:hypothetical protein